MEKEDSQNKKEKENTYQYIMRHIDIYGEPLNWYIGNHQTYNTTVGGCRTFIVIGCALIFLIYSIYNLFTDRNGSFLFYDITYLLPIREGWRILWQKFCNNTNDNTMFDSDYVNTDNLLIGMEIQTKK